MTRCLSLFCATRITLCSSAGIAQALVYLSIDSSIATIAAFAERELTLGMPGALPSECCGLAWSS
ncbi:MAG: hypothetical protein MK135_10135 [Polyangiaceae bacterium]|nr:hypothetical protein [Polyangiaceae bacterium]